MDVLYTQAASDALTNSESTESWRSTTDDLKAKLILENKGDAKSLVDIGCAWGQILQRLDGHFEILAGVDESRDRLNKLGTVSPHIIMMEANAAAIPCAQGEYDIALMSHIMHEILLFESADLFDQTILEVKRILSKPSGRLFIIDHVDPGEGEVTIRVDNRVMNAFRQFSERFVYREVQAEVFGDEISLSTRDCHDFVTKIWSLNSGAEDLEMNETHCICNKDSLDELLVERGLIPMYERTFNPITDMMNHYGIVITKGNSWDRQIFLSYGLED